MESKYSQWALLRSQGEQRGSAGSQRVLNAKCQYELGCFCSFWHVVTNLALCSSQYFVRGLFRGRAHLSTPNTCGDGMMNRLPSTLLLLAIVASIGRDVCACEIRHIEGQRRLY